MPHWIRVAAPVLALALALPVSAQKARDFEPHVGQAGKDVIWVPTPDDVVDRMLTMAQVTAKDYVVDLGAGDGKIAIAAARKFGARALGIEYNPDMVRHAQRNIERAGVAERARVVQGDIFTTDFSQATVLAMYLLPALNLKLRPQILAMRPGTRVVSHSFSMDDWEPDEVSSLDGRRAYFWVVPARVAGSWSLEMVGGGNAEKLDLTLEQRFQKIEGTVSLDALQGGLREPQLRGFLVSFAFVDGHGLRRDLSGRVAGSRMEGSFRTEAGTTGRWTATRK